MLKHPKKWPLIRHIRWFLLAWRLAWWREGVGLGAGISPHPAYERYLQDILEGRA